MPVRARAVPPPSDPNAVSASCAARLSRVLRCRHLFSTASRTSREQRSGQLSYYPSSRPKLKYMDIVKVSSSLDNSAIFGPKLKYMNIVGVSQVYWIIRPYSGPSSSILLESVQCTASSSSVILASSATSHGTRAPQRRLPYCPSAFIGDPRSTAQAQVHGWSLFSVTASSSSLILAL